jgi:hypothetical protein
MSKRDDAYEEMELKMKEEAEEHRALTESVEQQRLKALLGNTSDEVEESKD